MFSYLFGKDTNIVFSPDNLPISPPLPDILFPFQPNEERVD